MGRAKEREIALRGAGTDPTPRGLVSMRSALVLVLAAAFAAVSGLAAGTVASAAIGATPGYTWAPIVVGAAAGSTSFFKFVSWLDGVIEPTD